MRVYSKERPTHFRAHLVLTVQPIGVCDIHQLKMNSTYSSSTTATSLSLSTMIRQLQKKPAGSAAIPIFLFHDASGTISSYYALGPMERDVYAIADRPMEGNTYESIQEKSRRYYAAIKAQVPEGRILVGGNSQIVASSYSLTDHLRLVIRWNDCTSSRLALLSRP